MKSRFSVIVAGAKASGIPLCFPLINRVVWYIVCGLVVLFSMDPEQVTPK